MPQYSQIEIMLAQEILWLTEALTDPVRLAAFVDACNNHHYLDLLAYVEKLHEEFAEIESARRMAAVVVGEPGPAEVLSVVTGCHSLIQAAIAQAKANMEAIPVDISASSSADPSTCDCPGTSCPGRCDQPPTEDVGKR